MHPMMVRTSTVDRRVTVADRFADATDADTSDDAGGGAEHAAAEWRVGRAVHADAAVDAA